MKLTDAATIAGGIAAVLAILASVYAFYKRSFKKGRISSEANIAFQRKSDSYNKIYAPLRVELTNTRFVTYSSIGYPRFRQRFAHAFSEFNDKKHYKAKFMSFFKAISDKGESVSIECDTQFPSDKIKSIIELNPQYADKDLIDKVHELEVMAATPWDHDEDEIVEFQYHLANHIYAKYDSLHEELHNNAN
ncbi:hypothetical protein ACK8HJ_19030 [Vreelandella titanicae]|uniref:Uncharacterized protein n=1 Tax=Vreelandella titanicae BH1 TaxID=1204738 RepID=L9UBY5_9GAMM|nr:hypothetical protein [Halomonas titanicae]ELY21733.1 hypothetical protein HALTITAN_1292 [Halomonas titanicae BH1]NVE91179.1 hypothetical protein [Halomonas titanicae]